MFDLKKTALILAALSLTACGNLESGGGPLGAYILSVEGGQGRVNTDKTQDYGQGPDEEESLANLVAGIWVDPNGCDHWIIDDGVEGYLSARLDPFGKPVCSGVAEPTRTAGDFKGGSRINDPN